MRDKLLVDKAIGNPNIKPNTWKNIAFKKKQTSENTEISATFCGKKREIGTFFFFFLK